MLRMQSAVKIAIETKDRIWDAMVFTQGIPWWAKPQQLFDQVKTDIEDTFTMVKDELYALKNGNSDNPAYNGNPLIMGAGSSTILMIIDKGLARIGDEFGEIKNATKPFVEAYNSAVDTIDYLKAGFLSLKTKYEAATAMVMEMFGPKFHKTFPNVAATRECSDLCGCGVYPTTTGGRYSFPGMDLEIAARGNVTAPFDGKAYLTDVPKQVKLVPKSFFLKGKEVYIENVAVPRNTLFKVGMVQKGVNAHTRVRACLHTCVHQCVHVGTHTWVDSLF